MLWVWGRAYPALAAGLQKVLAAANLLTQGILILLLYLSLWAYWPTLLAGEGMVWLVEAGILCWASKNKLAYRQCLALSLLVNGVSFLVGLLLPV